MALVAIEPEANPEGGGAITRRKLTSLPLIAVTTSELRPSHPVTATPQGEPPQLEMALGLKYLKAIEGSGAIPVVVPPLRHDLVEPLLHRVSGVCLSGGPDLDPEAYGERRHELIGPTWRELDAFEIALARAADARGLPILAICRGLQVLNVARGGTLHQHVPDVVGERITHRQSRPGEEATHWVTLQDSSRLSETMGCVRTRVNSFHHQAVADLGGDLVISARSSDGTIEGIEASDRDFVLGVQWHAECLVPRQPQAALFDAFVASAERFEQTPARLTRAA
ncbi:MAG: gamma-glutamyl-gamma-aminobutyrate hydrolase family protein [Actinomycetota bacterium]|nr:gamma-glutamyl-gamma-aminobutyrate hydrolase family protein [Actinomycetota bacterium]